MRVAVSYPKELNDNVYTKVPITMHSMSLLQLHFFILGKRILNIHHILQHRAKSETL